MKLRGNDSFKYTHDVKKLLFVCLGFFCFVLFFSFFDQIRMRKLEEAASENKNSLKLIASQKSKMTHKLMEAICQFQHFKKGDVVCTKTQLWIVLTKNEDEEL